LMWLVKAHFHTHTVASSKAHKTSSGSRPHSSDKDKSWVQGHAGVVGPSNSSSGGSVHRWKHRKMAEVNDDQLAQVRPSTKRKQCDASELMAAISSRATFPSNGQHSMPHHQVLRCPWPNSIPLTFPPDYKGDKFTHVYQAGKAVGIVTRQHMTVSSLAQSQGYFFIYEFYVPLLDERQMCYVS
jgi:hypothetical protein